MGMLATIGVDGIDPFAVAAQRDAGGTFGTFLKFSGNTGIYTAGQDDEEMEIGTRLIVNVTELAAGWICWNDGKVVDEKNVRVIDGQPPEEDELPDHGPYEDEDEDGWREQRVILLADEDGKPFIFKTTSKSGIRAFGALLRAFADGRRREGLDKIPVIELEVTDFPAKNKKGKSIGKKYAPRFNIIDWKTEDELLALAAAGEDADDYDDEDEAPAPKKVTKSEEKKPRRQRATSKAKVEEDDDEDEEEEAPKRSRRQRKDEDEEEAPKKPRRRRRPEPEEDDDEDEDEDIPVNEEDDEDEEEAPKPKPGGRRRRNF